MWVSEENGLHELRDVLDTTAQEWKDDVLEVATDRFERRLGEELGKLRVETARDFAVTRVSLVRWMVATSMTQLGITFTFLTLLFHAAKLF